VISHGTWQAGQAWAQDMYLEALLEGEGGLAAILLALLRGQAALTLRRPLQAAHIILRS